jgi:hypothetical protein
MKRATPESPEGRPSAESLREELINRLSEINQRLSTAYETERVVETNLRGLMHELEELEHFRYGLVTERIEIEKQLYPEIFG